MNNVLEMLARQASDEAQEAAVYLLERREVFADKPDPYIFKSAWNARKKAQSRQWRADAQYVALEDVYAADELETDEDAILAERIIAKSQGVTKQIAILLRSYSKSETADLLDMRLQNLSREIAKLREIAKGLQNE